MKVFQGLLFSLIPVLLAWQGMGEIAAVVWILIALLSYILFEGNKETKGKIFLGVFLNGFSVYLASKGMFWPAFILWILINWIARMLLEIPRKPKRIKQQKKDLE